MIIKEHKGEEVGEGRERKRDRERVRKRERGGGGETKSMRIEIVEQKECESLRGEDVCENQLPQSQRTGLID